MSNPLGPEITETPMQRDRATTIYERSVEGRRAAQLPDSGVEERPLDELIPKSLNYEEPDEGLDLDYVTEGAKALPLNGHPAVGISNSFGFGGHNVVLCMEAAG